jgi:hypothetical protein
MQSKKRTDRPLPWAACRRAQMSVDRQCPDSSGSCGALACGGSFFRDVTAGVLELEAIGLVSQSGVAGSPP